MIDMSTDITAGGVGSILVVDDDPATARLHQKHLERAGYRIAVAETAEAASLAIADGGVELVVLDYRLSGELTGLEYYVHLKAAGFQLPVIMVTGFSQQSTVIEALRLGVRDFVTKSDRYLEYLPEAVRRVLKVVQTERQLAEAEERIRTQAALLNKATNAVFVVDVDNRIQFWNQGAERLYGWTEAEVLGQTTPQLPLWSKSLEQIEVSRRVLEEGEWSGELRGVSRDGKEVVVESQWTLLRDDAGHPKAQLVIDTDITEKKRLETHFLQAQRLESVGALAGGIAHEFNNLLQVIQGYTEYAMTGLTPEDQRFQDLEQVLTTAEKAATLTRQLLGFSRRQPLDRTVLNPNQALRELVTMLRPVLGASIELEVRLDDGVGLVQADAAQLQQVLLNLCVNARDAMPTGGCLRLSTGVVTISPSGDERDVDVPPGCYAVLTVSDTGCGMTSDVRRRIFEPFFTTKGPTKGTGLGLAMAYGIVKQHHGALHVKSSPGEGTTFTILLPTVVAQCTTSTNTDSESVTGGTETILVAEDDPIVRALAVRTLRGAGYTTLSAADGHQAVRVFEQHVETIALALLDVVMPKLNGRDVYQRIVAVRPDVPVIFCSGYDPTTDQVGLHVDEDQRLLQKPFSPATLLRTVRERLDTHQPHEAILCTR